MSKKTLTIFVIFSLFASVVASAEIDKSKLKDYISVLAADSLAGRQVGEIGEQKAAEYLVSLFKQFGLEPKGDSGSYLQTFDFIKKIETGPENSLTVNDQTLQLDTDWKPLPHSSDGEFSFSDIIDVGYGIISEDSIHNDYENLDVTDKAVLIRRYSPDTDSSSTDSTLEMYSDLITKINTAIDQGAKAVVFITPGDYEDVMRDRGVTKVATKGIPVIYLKRSALEKLGLNIDYPKIKSISGRTELTRVRDDGYNVVGYLRGKTDKCIIIGAHYDHIGWGGPTSRYLGEEPAIHNGADDNASGVATILELARYLADKKEKLEHSLLFIAFSGEEAGLLGSGHYVRNWTVPKENVTMMINIDMIGRLKDQENGLAILGVGTCSEFGEYFESLSPDNLKLTLKEAGSGPSDHAAFYNDSIPCLHFFTGAHEDYHTPADDIDKIDFDGIKKVSDLLIDIVEHFDTVTTAMQFVRTKGDDKGRHRKGYKVSLGIMPDFVSEVEGLKIDAVTPDGPADHAGLLKGDIIRGFDDIVVGDIYDYMNALAKFKKGDTTMLKVIRGGETLQVPLTF